MELWRAESEVARRPEVLSMRNVWIALAIHLSVFLVFFVGAALKGLFQKEEPIIPIDFTLIANENLDGKENEPPPLKNPEPQPKPEPPKPKPKPKEPEKPKELEKIVTNIVVKVEKKEEKKPAPKPEKPKKTKEELKKEREKRIADMRKRAKVTNTKKVKIELPNARESGDGRTERQTMSQADILKRLNEGYRPGTRNQLASSIEQRCLSLIQRALDEKWAQLMPSVGASGTVLLSAQFSSNGGLVNVRLTQSSGDSVSDAAALSVAKGVTFIHGLDPDFIARFRTEPLTIRYKVRGQ